MKCGNYEWDKMVDGTTVKCPKCGTVHDMDYPKCPNCRYNYEEN